MSKKPDNPHAFPVATIDGYTQDGMSLRDYFAGQALAGILSSREGALAIMHDRPEGMDPIPAIAIACGAYADALLAEREKGQ